MERCRRGHSGGLPVHPGASDRGDHRRRLQGRRIPAKRTRVNVIAVCSGAIAMLIFAPTLGLFGVGLGISVDAVVGATVAIALASSTMEIPRSALLGAIGPQLGAATIMAAVLFPVENLLVHAADHGTLLGLLLLSGEALLGAAVYLLGLRVLASGLSSEFRALLRDARRSQGPPDPRDTGDEVLVESESDAPVPG